MRDEKKKRNNRSSSQFSGKQFSKENRSEWSSNNARFITFQKGFWAWPLPKKLGKTQHRTDARKLRVSWEKSVKLTLCSARQQTNPKSNIFSSTLLTLEGEVWTLEWNKWDFVTSTQLWKIECNLTWKTCNYWLDLTHSHTKSLIFFPAFSFLMGFWTKYGRLK